MFSKSVKCLLRFKLRIYFQSSRLFPSPLPLSPFRIRRKQNRYECCRLLNLLSSVSFLSSCLKVCHLKYIQTHYTGHGRQSLQEFLRALSFFSSLVYHRKPDKTPIISPLQMKYKEYYFVYETLNSPLVCENIF